MEVIKDYDLVIAYHPVKANVVADALSRKSSVILAHIRTVYVSLLLDMKTMGISLDYDGYGALIASFMVRSTLVDQIRGKQMQNDELVKEVHKIMNGDIRENFWITQDGVLTMMGRVCVLDVDDLRRSIMEEAYCSTYVMHLKSTKMYRTIKKNYWWSGMKRDIVEFVSRCLMYQQVKAEDQKPIKTLQSLPILKWNWEHIIVTSLSVCPVHKPTTMPFG